MAIDNQVIRPSSPKRFIEMLQRQLIRENPSALPNFGVDGDYGAETRDWVSRFQERKGLQVDGDAGPETLGRLRSDIVLRPGTSGKGIEILQEDLLWFYISQSAVDGEYGPGTTQGVRDFQFLNNLVVDGSAGPNTLKKMDELLTQLYITEGDTGSLVRRIQHQLNEQDSVDISLDVDGEFGAATKGAVEDYQEENDLRVDGVVGPRTMYLLYAENSPLLTDTETEDALNSVGLTYEDAVESNVEKFADLFANHPEVQKILGNDTFEEVGATEIDFPDGTQDNATVMVIATVEGKANLMFAGHFFKETEELQFFSKQDIFGNLPDDEVEITTYQIDDDGVSIETVSNTNIDLENQGLESEIAFRDAIQQAEARNATLAVVACGGTLIMKKENDKISIQGWDDVLGISCGIVFEISALVASKKIIAAFPFLVSGGAAAAIPIILSLVALTSAWFVCGWLADQV